jgi:hypothetical protein
LALYYIKPWCRAMASSTIKYKDYLQKSTPHAYSLYIQPQEQQHPPSDLSHGSSCLRYQRQVKRQTPSPLHQHNLAVAKKQKIT